jgi:MSHA biogenesis protein MshQ
VKYELKGTSPSRYMLVTWDNVRQYGASATNFSLQVALFESPAGINGDFEYRYISGFTNGLGTTIGVQVNGTDWFSYNPSTNNTTTAAPIDQATGTSIRWTALTTPPIPAATYFFNETSYNGTAGEVIDSSGLGKHAKAVGGVTTVNTSTTCSASGRAANFPANTTASTITAIQTPVTVGYTGSVNFWYNGTGAWNDGNAAMLFDATNAANTAPFYLMKTTTGQLQFTAAANAASSTITAKSPAQTFAATTLKHISVSWVFLPGTNQTYVQMFLDGVMVLNQRFTITKVSGVGYPNTGAFDTTRTLNIGDTRNTTAPSGGTLNSANGWIDDFKVYNSQVNSYVATSDKSCTALVHHLEISAASSPMQPCKANTLTVKACKDAACTTTYNSGLTATLTNSGTPAVAWDSTTGGATGADILTGGSGTASKGFQITT